MIAPRAAARSGRESPRRGGIGWAVAVEPRQERRIDGEAPHGGDVMDAVGGGGLTAPDDRTRESRQGGSNATAALRRERRSRDGQG